MPIAAFLLAVNITANLSWLALLRIAPAIVVRAIFFPLWGFLPVEVR
jgi:hypothetical protein